MRLPAWECNQIPALVRRSVKSQGQHALLSLAPLNPTRANDLPWRLSRREACGSLAAVTLTSQRSMAGPRQVRPPLDALEALQARSYQLLAQLTAIKSLLLRHVHLDMSIATPALEQASRRIQAELVGPQAAPGSAAESGAVVAGQPFQTRPDPLAAADQIKE